MATKSKSTKAKKTATAKKANGKAAAKSNKTAKVIALMRRASGVTRAEILAQTGWAAVSPQAIAATAGLKIKLEKVKGKTIVYRV